VFSVHVQFQQLNRFVVIVLYCSAQCIFDTLAIDVAVTFSTAVLELGGGLYTKYLLPTHD